ncbi:dihydropteroate synthase [Halobacteria archaeon AArc-curdl1]|uniref:Probable bifunctional folylpolyglutamate synthase/dihydropteroate synthase n=1 Tax=Natronosalvus hydrolyticus TaxID=2979988 RepID=A0AAP2Z9X5_9EURY|nr:dihydropteroate synthase [Halobacteria archaeon AArc-curdl1]
MEYHEAAEFLFSLRRFRPSPGTESTRAFLESLENPHEDVSFVQVAGSNGKGSTARMLESTLREHGLTVGLFTSPHLEDLRERIRVDGRKIPKAAVREFADTTHDYVTRQAADGESPTFFEAITTLALWHFGRADVDVAVLEVGIGGRYDATSVVDPVASAVTSVSLEHTSVIGDTVEEIAADKAQVASTENPLVTGTTGAALETIRAEVGDVVTVGPANRDGERPDVAVTYHGPTNHAEASISLAGPEWSVETRIPVIGAHQAENAGIAATLAGQVADISQRDLERGLRNAHWPGRFEVMDTAPLTVLDGAHNPGACERLAETLEAFEYDDLHLVFGAMHDKDHREMVATLPTANAAAVCEPELDRAADGDVLATVLEDAGVETVCSIPSVSSAVAHTLERAGPDDCVLVTGSLFAVAEARRRWTRAATSHNIETLDDEQALLERTDVDGSRATRVAGSGVHRVITIALPTRQAAIVERELVRLGGNGITSSVRVTDEPVETVLMGTLTQFDSLVGRLSARDDGLAEVGAHLRDTLDFEQADIEPRYPWQAGPCVMGILNVTPDSFHDGGEYERLEDALERARAMVDAGATIIDVGGESTRPGADPVSTEDEIDRVVPVIERLSDGDLEALVSVDTRKAAVAEAALEAGADIINDVTGLGDPEMRFVAADHDVPLVLMHSIDAPVIPDRNIEYDDVVDDVIDQLTERVLLAEKAGLDREQIVIDPGLGFGKTAPESFELLGRLQELQALGCPLLVGHSHKSMFANVGREHGDRLEPTIAATALAVDRGADIVRVHDVEENVAALKTARALENAR